MRSTLQHAHANMEHTAVNGSVHTGCKQHQRVCAQNLRVLCEWGPSIFRTFPHNLSYKNRHWRKLKPPPWFSFNQGHHHFEQILDHIFNKKLGTGASCFSGATFMQVMMVQFAWILDTPVSSSLTRMYTAYQFPNTLKYTKVKVPHTQDKHTQLSSFAQLFCYPIKSLADTNPPEYVDRHSLLTDYLCP